MKPEPKDEFQLFTQLRSRWDQYRHVRQLKKKIKNLKKEVIQNYVHLGKNTYRRYQGITKDDEAPAMSALIHQRLISIEEMSRQVRMIKSDAEEQQIFDQLR